MSPRVERSESEPSSQKRDRDDFDMAMRESRPPAKRAPTPLPSVTPSQARYSAVNADVERFVQVVLRGDDEQLRAHIAKLREDGVGAEAIFLDLLAPAARALGEKWSDDSCDFVDVTIALGKLQSTLRELSSLFVSDRPDTSLVGRVLLACVPGEQHSFGLFMVAEFFIRDGWGVRVGPPVSEAELLLNLRSEWYDVVGFSVSCDSRLDHLKREIARVRHASMNPNVLVMAGGRAFNDQPELLARIGADASAARADLAPIRARQMLAIS